MMIFTKYILNLKDKDSKIIVETIEASHNIPEFK